MKTIITTVGTSVFTNLIKISKKSKTINGHYKELENMNFSDWNKKNIVETRQELYNLIKSEIEKQTEKASAEIESILKIANGEKVMIHLLATDTILSVLAAEIIKEWFKDKQTVHFNAQYGQDVIKGLQVEDVNLFRKSGLPNLLKRLDELIVDENNSPYNILNITGGYKALIPFATTYAQINEIAVYYLFEDSNQVIKFPAFPINVNYSLISQYISIFRDLSDCKEGNWQIYKNQYQLNDFFDNYIDIIEDEKIELFELNSIGKYLLNRFDNYILIQVERGCNLFGDSVGNRKQIIRAINELYSRIAQEIELNKLKNSTELLNYINNLGDKSDLRHGTNPKSNVFIFKSTDETQIRIVYEPILKQNFLSFNIYDYNRGGSNFNHSKYISELSQKFRLKSEFGYINLAIKKA